MKHFNCSEKTPSFRSSTGGVDKVERGEIFKTRVLNGYGTQDQAPKVIYLETHQASLLFISCFRQILHGGYRADPVHGECTLGFLAEPVLYRLVRTRKPQNVSILQLCSSREIHGG